MKLLRAVCTLAAVGASAVVLAQAPDAARWAETFNRDMRTTAKGFHRHGAPNTVRHAVVGIAHACIPDPDAMLRDLLVGGIGDCAHGRPPDRPRHPQAGTDRIAVPATQPMGPPA